MDQRMEMHWYIKVWMRTLEEPVVFEVTKEDMERFERIYGSGQDGFFVCATRKGTHIAINLKHVEAANLLWDAGVLEVEDSEQRDVLAFTAGDGELMMFDPVSVVYLEVPTPVVEDGQRELESELEEGKRPRSRKLQRG